MATIREVFESRNRITGDAGKAREILHERAKEDHSRHIRELSEINKNEILKVFEEKIQKTERRINELKERIKENIKEYNQTKSEYRRRQLDEKINSDEHEIRGREEVLNKLVSEKQNYEKISPGDALKYDAKKISENIEKYANSVMGSYFARSEYEINLGKITEEIKKSPQWKEIKEKTGLGDKASYHEIIKAIEEYNKKAGEYNKKAIFKEISKKQIIEEKDKDNKGIAFETKAKQITPGQMKRIEETAGTNKSSYYLTKRSMTSEEMLERSGESRKIKEESTAHELATRYNLDELIKIYTNPSAVETVKMFIGLDSNIKEKYNTLSRAIEIRINKDIYERVEERFGAEYRDIYLETQKKIDNAAQNPSITQEEFESIKKSAANEYYNKTEMINNKVKDYIQAYADTAKKVIADKDILNRLRGINVVNTASVALISSALTAYSTTAFASTLLGKTISYGIVTLGGISLAKSALDTCVTLNELNKNDLLTRERAVAVVVPTAVLFAVAIGSSAATKSYMSAKLEPISKELRYNIFGDPKNAGQIINNEALMSRIFSQSNLRRGYAELPYRGYMFRIPVNENLYSRVKLAQAIYNEGTKIDVNTEGISIIKKYNIQKIRQISKELETLFRKDEVLIQKESLSVIKSREFTRVTKIPVKSDTMISIGGQYRGRPIEILLSYSPKGELKIKYISVKIPTVNEKINIIRIASVMSDGNVKPIKDFLVFSKNVSYKAFQKGDYIIGLSKDQYLIKQILGSTNKNILDLNQFLKGMIIFKKPYANKGDIFVGEQKTLSVKKAADLDKSLIQKEIDFFKARSEKIDPLTFKIQKTKIDAKTGPIKSDYDPLKISDVKKISKDIDFLTKSKKVTELKKQNKLLPGNIMATLTVKETKPQTLLKSAKVAKEGPKMEPFFLDAKNIKTTQKLDIVPKTEQKTPNLNKSKIEGKNELRELTRPLQNINTIGIERTTTASWNKTATRQEPVNAPKFDAPKINIGTPKITTPKPARSSTNFIPSITAIKPKTLKIEMMKKSPKPMLKKEDPFYYEIKRYGKWKTSKAFDSLDSALKEAKTKVKSTLAATFRIKKGNRIEDIDFVDKDFYKKATKEGSLFIEKRQKRLDMPTEIFEIQKARKTKNIKKSAESFWLR